MAGLDKAKFNLGYLIKGESIKDWWKAWGGGIKLIITLALLGLLILGGFKLVNWFFPSKPPVQNNTQTVTIQPGSTVNFKTENIQKNDRGYEAGIFGGGLTLGSQAGVFGGVEFRKKW